MSDNKDEKKPGIPSWAGQVVGGASGTYIGYQAGEQLVEHAIDKLDWDLSSDVVEATEATAAIGAGLATGSAAVMMARKDANYALFYGARTAAALGVTAIGIKVANEVSQSREELHALSQKLDETHVASNDALTDYPNAPYRYQGRLVDLDTATHGMGTDDPNGGPSNDPDIAFDPVDAHGAFKRAGLTEYGETASHSMGTDDPNGGPSNDPDIALSSYSTNAGLEGFEPAGYDDYSAGLDAPSLNLG